MNLSHGVKIIGLITVGLGVAGLAVPDLVMTGLGWGVGDNADPAQAYGEVSATLGGLFTVLGLWTLWVSTDLPGQRGPARLIGSLWLGIAAGRLLAVGLKGDPGWFGWASLAFEVVLGSVLLIAAMTAREPENFGGPRVDPAAGI